MAVSFIGGGIRRTRRKPVGSGVKHHNREFRIDELHHNVVCISAYYITVFVFQITNPIFVKDNFI